MTAGEIGRRLTDTVSELMKVMKEAQSLSKKASRNHHVRAELQNVIPRGNSMIREIRGMCTYCTNMGEHTEVSDQSLLSWPARAETMLKSLRATVEHIRAWLG